MTITSYEVRTRAIERGLYARKIRGRDAWTVEHPDGRISTEVSAAELVAALTPADPRGPVVIGGEDFGSHRECRWRHGTGTRTVAQMWADLCREHDATAPVPVTLAWRVLTAGRHDRGGLPIPPEETP